MVESHGHLQMQVCEEGVSGVCDCIVGGVCGKVVEDFTAQTGALWMTEEPGG